MIKMYVAYPSVCKWDEEAEHYFGYVLDLGETASATGNSKVDLIDNLCVVAQNLIEHYRKTGKGVPSPVYDFVVPEGYELLGAI